MCHQMRRVRGGLLVVVPFALAACESLDRLAFGPEPAPEATGLSVMPLDDDVAYPSVNTVPPRPQLSYSIEQQRAIVSALISDRENASYTSDAVRYRTGRSNLPPPPAPPAASLAVDQVVPAPVPAMAADPVLVDVDEDSSSDDSARTLEQQRAQLDDGSLDDFVRQLVDETDPDPGLETQTVIMDQAAPEPDIVPGQGPRESAFPKLFGAMLDLFRGEAEAAQHAPAGTGDETRDPAAGGGDAPAAGDGPAPSPQKPPAAEPEEGREPGTGGASGARPVLKPDESADPPAPAPEKPDEQAMAPATSPSQVAGLVLYPRAPSV